jgi:hypothetical protein
MVAATICPKCDYTRQPADEAPAWQCPSCGVAYNKVRAPVPEAHPTPARARARGAPREMPERVVGQPMQIFEASAWSYAGLLYFGALFAGFFFENRAAWIVALSLMTVISFLAWLDAYRTKRAVLDVPTSRARSAAQGYVELHGNIVLLDGMAVKAPLTLAPCVWYSFRVIEGMGKNARTIESGSAALPFLLGDETGTCLVDPRGASLVCDLVSKWTIDNRHYSEWTMRPGDPIYAIGEFRSDPDPQASAKEVTAQLRGWLRDPKAFFARFDTNRDGKVSRAELDAANEAARREAVQRYFAQGGKHRLVEPRDGRPYVIAGWSHEKVAEHYTLATTAHFLMCLITAGFLVYHLA